LGELIKLRASQINGCAYCIDMHSKDARASGEASSDFNGLVAWRETPYYSERERAALAWTEALILIADNHVPNEVYDQARKQFSEQEFADLTLAVIAINAGTAGFAKSLERTSQRRIDEHDRSIVVCDWFLETREERITEPIQTR